LPPLSASSVSNPHSPPPSGNNASGLRPSALLYAGDQWPWRRDKSGDGGVVVRVLVVTAVIREVLAELVVVNMKKLA